MIQMPHFWHEYLNFSSSVTNTELQNFINQINFSSEKQKVGTHAVNGVKHIGKGGRDELKNTR